MKRNLIRVFCTAFVLVLLPQTLSAQYEKKISSKDSTALANARAVSDTGRMTPGGINLLPYDNPAYCLTLIESTTKKIWRSDERDTLHEDRDSIPALAREKGRECISKFTLTTVSREQLPAYLHAASILKDTSLMRSIINYALQSDSVTDYYKIHFLDTALEFGYAATKPDLADFVPSLLRQLTKFGKEAAPSVARAYSIIKAHHYRNFDTAQFIATANERAVYLSQFSDDEVPARQKMFNEIYQDSLALVLFRRPPDYADQVKRFTEALTDIQMFRDVADLQASLIGKLPSDMDLVAAFPSTASAVPQKGKVTVYLRQGFGIKANNTLTPQLAKFRRLMEKYGPEKLEVVLVTTATGYMWDSPPLEPEVEAKLQNWYYREYHGLPFTVLVNKRNISRRTDGRLIRDNPLFDDFLNGSRMMGYMVGKDGTVQAWTEAFIAPETVIEKYIERELAK